jgi:hypothetical protein
MDAKSLLILILILVVGVLGYLYYDSQQSGVEVDIGTILHSAPAEISPA